MMTKLSLVAGRGNDAVTDMARGVPRPEAVPRAPPGWGPATR